jgi:hypothetical protein
VVRLLVARWPEETFTGGSHRFGGQYGLEAGSCRRRDSRSRCPTRRPLAPQNGLVNPVNLRLHELAPQLKSRDVDAVVCALGTTKAKAGSQEAFRYVDYTLPLVIAKAAHAAGAETFALVSAIGAATNSMFLYARTKGEVERDIQQIGFCSLTICRRSVRPPFQQGLRMTVLTVSTFDTFQRIEILQSLALFQQLRGPRRLARLLP